MEDDLLAKPSELAQKFEHLKNVPIGIDLKNKGLIGVIGQNQEAAAILRDLVIQAATTSVTPI